METYFDRPSMTESERASRRAHARRRRARRAAEKKAAGESAFLDYLLMIERSLIRCNEG